MLTPDDKKLMITHPMDKFSMEVIARKLEIVNILTSGPFLSFTAASLGIAANNHTARILVAVATAGTAASSSYK